LTFISRTGLGWNDLILRTGSMVRHANGPVFVSDAPGFP
jgi:hypothetical protein